MKKIDAVGIWFYAVDTKRHLFLMRDDKKYSGHWGLPGGKVEKGESLLDAIIRECEEEMGLMPDYRKLIPIERFTADGEKFIYNTFYCVVDHEFTPNLNHEHVGYAWIDGSIIPKPLHPGFWATLKGDDIFQRISSLKNALDVA